MNFPPDISFRLIRCNAVISEKLILFTAFLLTFWISHSSINSLLARAGWVVSGQSLGNTFQIQKHRNWEHDCPQDSWLHPFVRAFATRMALATDQPPGQDSPNQKPMSGLTFGLTITNASGSSKSNHSDIAESTNLPSPNRFFTEDPNQAIHLVVVANRNNGNVRETDGAFFPKEDGWVHIRHFSSDPYVMLVGLPPREYDSMENADERTKYFSGGTLRLHNLELSVKNGQLSAFGILRAPLVLSFETPPTQPRILLWPAGCQAIIESEYDTNANITLHGGDEYLNLFENIVNASDNRSVGLYMNMTPGDCGTNLPVKGRKYRSDCLAAVQAQARERNAALQQQIDATAAFEKFFHLIGSQGADLPFWQELDQKCQLVTQGRLGILEYGFPGDDSCATAYQAVISDLAIAPGLTGERRNMVETTLTTSNLAAMVAIEERLAWDKNLPQISAQLRSRQQKLRSTAPPSLNAEFRLPADNGLDSQALPLGRLAFVITGSTIQIRATDLETLREILRSRQ